MAVISLVWLLLVPKLVGIDAELEAKLEIVLEF